ncbi:MAG: ferredoxin-type protein NapF [Campylobacterota bacterium]|nr:ferredoxin-type protein NapF [Campylobacterota bacterium]
MASRRDFFTAFRKPLDRAKKGEGLIVRPPYGLFESLFQSECPACESQACVTSCEEEIILIRADKTPMLNFSKSGCTFCEACAIACEADVLSLANGESTGKIHADFRISTEGCVAHNGVICFSCKEPCIDDAILFNGMFNPVIDMEKCTGCGFCLSRCPTQAISYVATEIVELEKE